MNKFVYIFACLSVFACKANVNAPAASANNPPPQATTCAPHDNFAAAGQIAGDSSRWVYNKSKQVYEYLTSEEAKRFYAETWDNTKEEAGKAYDSAIEAYHEHQENTAKEEEKKSTSTP